MPCCNHLPNILQFFFWFSAKVIIFQQNIKKSTNICKNIVKSELKNNNLFVCNIKITCLMRPMGLLVAWIFAIARAREHHCWWKEQAEDGQYVVQLFHLHVWVLIVYSITNSTGQWSDPKISVWMAADTRRSFIDDEVRK